MANPVTLSNLISRAQSMADQKNFGFIQQTEWISWANTDLQALWNLLTQADPDNYILANPVTLPVANGQAVYPPDMLNLIEITMQVGAFFVRLEKYMRQEADRTQFIGTLVAFPFAWLPKYRLRGNVINLLPQQSITGNLNVFYVPIAPQLALAQPTTTIDVPSNGQQLPQATINVISTTGFPSQGQLELATSNGTQLVWYTGLTATSFTGCAGATQQVPGGPGVLSTGGTVTSGSITTSFDGIDGYDEMVVLRMAIRAKAKADQDTSVLAGMLNDWEHKIAVIAATTKDNATPDRIVDVRSNWNRWSYSGGGSGGF